jgi:O-antigen/teichoic acid export membrane protein
MKFLNVLNFVRINIPLKIQVIFVNGLYAFSQWLIMICLTRFQGLAEVGLYSSILMFISPIFLFFSMQLRVYYITQDMQDLLLENIKLLRALNLLFAFFLSLVLPFFLLDEKLHNFKFFSLLLILCLIKMLEGYTDVVYGYLQKKGAFNLFIKSLFFRSFLIILATIIGLVVVKNTIFTFALMFLFLWLYYFLFDRSMCKKINIYIILKKSIYDINKIKVIAYSTLGLGLAAVLDSLLINGQRFLLINDIGLIELGAYVSILQLILVTQIVVTSLGQYFIPQLKLQVLESPKLFWATTIKLFLFTLVLGLFMILIAGLFGNNFLSFIYGPYVSGYSELLNIITVGGLFYYLSSSCGYVLLALKQYKKQVTSIVVAIFFMLVTTPYFVELYGIIGAAISIAVAYLGRFITSFYFCMKFLLILRKTNGH